MPTVVFRMSCIYGPHQFGTEDQGWIAHFLLRALRGEPIMIYGDGCQVRDILFVDDLARAMLLAHHHIDDLSGQAFNIGGGPRNTVSLLELVEIISKLHRNPAIEFGQWRSADQRFYVSDIDNFSAATGWVPQVRVAEGIGRLYRWLQDNRITDPCGAPLDPSGSAVVARLR
jgi:CDP-paratose 2-epimerase